MLKELKIRLNEWKMINLLWFSKTILIATDNHDNGNSWFLVDFYMGTFFKIFIQFIVLIFYSKTIGLKKTFYIRIFTAYSHQNQDFYPFIVSLSFRSYIKPAIPYK